MSATRIIKKYPNRRLYDTEISSYITIEDVRQLIVDGEEFEVRDARTDQDITRLVLLQIIAEREEEGQPMLSTGSLQLMIRFYGDPLHGFMSRYIERSLQLFLEQQHTLRKQLDEGSTDALTLLDNQIAERNLDLWKNFQQGVLKGGTLGSGPVKKKAAGTRAKAAKAPAKKVRG